MSALRGWAKLTKAQRAKLDTAQLFRVRWEPQGKPFRYADGAPRYRYFIQKLRFANAAHLRIGSLILEWRMPWLAEPARQSLSAYYDEGRS